MSEEQNYYKSLGVDPSASADEIQQAYLKLSLEYAPDQNPYMREKFFAVQRAYDVLKSPESRKAYDQFLADASDALREETQHSEGLGQGGRQSIILEHSDGTTEILSVQELAHRFQGTQMMLRQRTTESDISLKRVFCSAVLGSAIRHAVNVIFFDQPADSEMIMSFGPSIAYELLASRLMRVLGRRREGAGPYVRQSLFSASADPVLRYLFL